MIIFCTGWVCNSPTWVSLHATNAYLDLRQAYIWFETRHKSMFAFLLLARILTNIIASPSFDRFRRYITMANVDWSKMMIQVGRGVFSVLEYLTVDRPATVQFQQCLRVDSYCIPDRCAWSFSAVCIQPRLWMSNYKVSSGRCCHNTREVLMQRLNLTVLAMLIRVK